jgi:RimJ/RimL family protein N-acetyltransferase
MQNKNKLNQPIGATIHNWTDALPPPRTKIVGQYCTIEPLNISAHAESLFNAFATDTENKNWTYMIDGPFDDFSAFQSWLKRIAISDNPLCHSIIDHKTNGAVGLASYMRINEKQGVIEVGSIQFSPLMQRTQIATEAMFLMMQSVFDELGYRRYEWKCDSLNEKSRNAALRLGFTFEGIFRQAIMYKGRNRDTAWYSIIDTEWPRLKQAFKLWLKPANFDSAGRQRTRLADLLSKQGSEHQHL